MYTCVYTYIYIYTYIRERERYALPVSTFQAVVGIPKQRSQRERRGETERETESSSEGASFSLRGGVPPNFPTRGVPSSGLPGCLPWVPGGESW